MGRTLSCRCCSTALGQGGALLRPVQRLVQQPLQLVQHLAHQVVWVMVQLTVPVVPRRTPLLFCRRLKAMSNNSIGNSARITHNTRNNRNSRGWRRMQSCCWRVLCEGAAAMPWLGCCTPRRKALAWMCKLAAIVPCVLLLRAAMLQWRVQGTGGEG